MTLQGTLGFLGFGNMGRAIIGGLLEKSTVSTRHVLVHDIDPLKREEAKRLGVGVADSPMALATGCDALVLAVKPQNVTEALDEIKPGLGANTLIISICAGISTAFIQSRLGEQTRVVRVMPNTPALVNAGAAGVALSANCTQDDAAVARTVFESVGIVELVAESEMDAVTALSGSGPAYFFYMVECLVDAAVAEGLAPEQATRLAAQTLLGAGLLLSQSEESAAVLRQRVTSKGGTTEAALRTFMEGGFGGTVKAGVAAAAARSRELGQ